MEICCSGGRIRALVWFNFHVFKVVIESMHNSITWSLVMVKNYFKIAFRNVLRQKTSSLINISGFAAAISVCLLIVLYVYNIITFDSFHENGDSIFLVYKIRNTPTGEQRVLDTWVPMKDAFLGQYPEIEEGARDYDEIVWVEYNGLKFQEKMNFVDETFLQMFSFPLEEGDEESVLSDPNSIVISKEIARKYFGNTKAIGKVLQVNYKRSMIVRGVLKDIPPNSSFHFDIIANITQHEDYKAYLNSWGTSFLYTYIQLKNEADPLTLESKFPQFIENTWGKESAERMSFKLLPLAEMNNELNNYRSKMQILITIAISIISIALINFVNLTTAHSMRRLREIGLRKVFGAKKSRLIMQFLCESMLLSMLSLVAAVLFTLLFLEPFNTLVGMDNSLNALADPKLLSGLLLVLLIAGMISGLYPAFILSRYKPTEAFKGKIVKGLSGKKRFQRMLVTAQFALSIILVSTTGTIFHQMDYLKNYDLSFDRNNVAVMEVSVEDFKDSQAVGSRIQVFKEKVKQINGVESVSLSASIPGRYRDSYTMVKPDGIERKDPLRMRYAVIDLDFFNTFGVEFTQGDILQMENLEEGRQRLTVINESARSALGYDDAVDKTIMNGSAKILGVVRDFNYQSLRNPIQPVLHVIMKKNSTSFNYVSVKINQGSERTVINSLKQYWNILDVNRDFNLFFIDGDFNMQYQNEENSARIVLYSAIMAVIIACLGLLGVVTFTTEQRTREIGIRKVLGASSSKIVTQIMKEFLQYVVLANAVAWPIAYISINKWLNQFAYQVGSHFGMFLISGFITLVIAVLTVSFRSIKAAFSDPVDSLRYE